VINEYFRIEGLKYIITMGRENDIDSAHYNEIYWLVNKAD